MTTEGDLQAMLDARPDDHQTRGVLGDFLTDLGDPRGPGYCALARAEAAPKQLGTPTVPQWCWWNLSAYRGYAFPVRGSDLGLYGDGIAHAMLPAEWFGCLDGLNNSSWDTVTRREAEDAAALAWAELTDDQRAGILRAVEG